MKDFSSPTLFRYIVAGQQFVEVMTTCNEVAVRIEPVSHKGKTYNARRQGGKLIAMADWEPVMVDPSPLSDVYPNG